MRDFSEQVSPIEVRFLSVLSWEHLILKEAMDLCKVASR